MKTTRALWMAASLIALSLGVCGCFTQSLYPLYDRENEDPVFDDRLIGTWKATDSDVWIVRPGEDGYAVIRERGEERAAFEARLIRLETDLYLDLQPDPRTDLAMRYRRHLTYTHSISRVGFAGDTLKLEMLARVVPDTGPGKTGGLTIVRDFGADSLIISPTPVLRAYLLEHSRKAPIFDLHVFTRVRG